MGWRTILESDPLDKCEEFNLIMNIEVVVGRCWEGSNIKDRDGGLEVALVKEQYF